MRLKICGKSLRKVEIPFNYQFQLQAAIYNIISKSSKEYSTFLHDHGYLDENKHLKMFTFSKLILHKARMTKGGFSDFNSFHFYLATPMPKSLEHIVLGIFSDGNIMLKFGEKKYDFTVDQVETLEDPTFKDEMKFSCLSPIAVSANTENISGKHYLDYMIPEERDSFVTGIQNNLLRKYRIVHGKDFEGNADIEFNFDPLYIVKRQGKIRKNIKFKNSRIIGMEAPFTIKADPELIKIGYDCGFGENNSAGFGMVEKV